MHGPDDLADADPGIDYPVFILGAERSGTSTVAYLLHDAFGYSGYAEGHVFDLLHSLLGVVDGFFEERQLPDLLTQPATPPHWQGTNTAIQLGRHSIRSYLKRLFADLVRQQYTGHWFDKTPGPGFIRAAPLLAELYPNALFIFLIRDPIANIESRLRKFGDPFQDACERWSQCAQAWLVTKPLLRNDSYVELRTHELSTDMQGSWTKLKKLLAQHPVSPRRLDASSPPTLPPIQRTSLGALGDVRPISQTGWTLDQQDLFHDICGPFLVEYGFSQMQEKRPPSDRTLPPPHGQSGLLAHHGKGGLIFPQVHKGEEWIFLHPSESPPATTLEYRGIDLSSVSAIATTFTVINEAGPRCRLTAAISDESLDEVHAASTVECDPGEETELVVYVPIGVGRCRVTFTSESSSSSITHAWAQMRCARLIDRST